MTSFLVWLHVAKKDAQLAPVAVVSLQWFALAYRHICVDDYTTFCAEGLAEHQKYVGT